MNASTPQPASPDALATNAVAFNPFQRFIRVVHVQASGMVEFEFALGEPEMFVEMIMPMPVFREFCQAQGLNADSCLAQAQAQSHGQAPAHLSFLM